MLRSILKSGALGLTLAGAVAIAPGVATAQDATDYPSRAVTMIIPFGPGGSTDPVARAFAEKLSAAWGEQVIAENRPGAGGSVGGTALVTSEPDGYTMLVVNPGPAILAPMLSASVEYEPSDLKPVVLIGEMPQIAIVRSDFPADDMAGLVAYAKENPGAVLWGSSGVNSSPHVTLELLKESAGIDITHVPYSGSGAAITDLLGGSIQGMYSTPVTAAGLIESGDVKVLGVAGAKRHKALPDVPTLEEQGIMGANASVWLAIVVPQGTPDAIVQKINADMNDAIAAPDLQGTIFSKLNPLGGTVAEFEAYMADEEARVQRLIDSGTLEVQ
ncbi:tripartite tricarboxylate transporter substrate binding protein [Paralimibaculum aggregatum]|uniref:Tripartite tricarboxylate transporter substrate binding protein n=1 Tax=Paralimibaculum aggregatum TaxID=3036245 RepID=A0ABQ6LTW5_9RHOB|nr:tripartite tricarboxylate transporter substrate binding protein [Limibaculum sp. NKW23]GMG85514.1 tripartite tricarboxylate transporter substrate binding protein [Limibaculum sp. NKW23]